MVEHAKIGIVANEGAALHARGSTIQLCGLGINSKAPIILENVVVEECGRGVVAKQIDERGDCALQEDRAAPALDDRARARARLRLARRQAFGDAASPDASSDSESEDMDGILAANSSSHVAVTRFERAHKRGSRWRGTRRKDPMKAGSVDQPTATWPLTRLIFRTEVERS